MLAKLRCGVLTWNLLIGLPLRAILLLAVVGMAPSLPSPTLNLLFAQGGSIWGQLTQPAPPVGTGGPAVNPLIYVCPSTSSGNPCPATVQLYSDPALTQPISNPYTGDQNGNFSFWLATGVYLVQAVPVSGTTYQYLVLAQGGTVTSITLNLPAQLFSPSTCGPITSIGVCTFGLASQLANTGLFAPNGSNGAPSFRNVVAADFGSSIAANSVLANCTGSSASAAFCSITANMLPSVMNGTTFSGNVNVGGSFSATSLTGTFGGNPTFSGNLTFIGSTNFENGITASGIGVTSATMLELGTELGGSDLAGQLTFTSSTTSSSYSFTLAGSHAPRCTITPLFDPGSGVRVWISTLSATTLQASASSSISGTVDYVCIGQFSF